LQPGRPLDNIAPVSSAQRFKDTNMTDARSASSPKRPRPVVLCVLDGWGERAERDNNAIAQARTPVWDRIKKAGPFSLLQASEEQVGLPHGQMGNSEVGHMNLGSGRVVTQELPRIDRALAEGKVIDAPRFVGFVGALKKSGGTAHLLGLVSPGGVHSHQDQIAALAALIAGEGVPVAVHAFLDGRDTPPQSALGYMDDFLKAIDGIDGIRVATVGGRYFAMDRDKRWDRVERAYRAVHDGAGVQAADPLAAIRAAYAAGTTDEFMPPAVIGAYAGMKDGDGVFGVNFRADRMREILSALLDESFDAFKRTKPARFAAALGLVEYSAALGKKMDTLFSPQSVDNILGQVVADAELHQLRIAETEKYAHVTFFFNGGREDVFPGEERILVPSPKVATYDLQPEMSAPELTDKLVDAVGSGRFDLIVVNYANGDMVGHSGKLDAAIKAAEAIDQALGRLTEAVVRAGGVLLVTADHGNLEQMWDAENNGPHTAHTCNPVPLVAVNAPAWVRGLKTGALSDIAPTILRLMDLPKPAEMTGRSLIVEGEMDARAAQ
jgi:2,3-bisphosphoglycerate-independent phosphoglycerate mutase